MLDRIRRAGQVSWAAVGIALFVAIIGLVVWYFRVILPPLLLAGAIVFILNPVVTFLQRRGIPRALGTAISYVCCLGIVVGIGFLVAPIVTDQWSEMSDRIPEIRDDVDRPVERAGRGLPDPDDRRGRRGARQQRRIACRTRPRSRSSIGESCSASSSSWS